MGKMENTQKVLITFGEMTAIAIHEGKKMRSKLDDIRETFMCCWICR